MNRLPSSKWFHDDAWIRALLLLGICSTPLACGGAEIPDTPDLSKWQEEFRQPTAVLDETSVGEALLQMPSLRQLSAGFRAAGSTTDNIDTVDQQTASGSGSRLNIQGSIKVNVRCPGALDERAFGPNGSIDLTLALEKNLIKRGVAMRAHDCVMRGDAFGTPVRVEIDGPILMDLGGDLGLRQRWAGRLLMVITGTIDIDGLTLDNLAARWDKGTFEYLFRLPNEDTWVIAAVTTDGTVSVRDRDTTWSCPDGQACSTF
ncbi:MAG TPA: hypothetical protein VFV94_05640 [Polyangiaceae bacterium]|jgi:hypothetical protein|nr:hypothetical protein [Polyangiaceae bacterium]